MIKSRTVMPKATFDKRQTLFTNEMDLNVRKKLLKCCVWKVVMHGPEPGPLRKLDQKYMESFELRCWERMEKLTWADRVRKEVLQRVREERNILYK